MELKKLRPRAIVPCSKDEYMVATVAEIGHIDLTSRGTKTIKTCKNERASSCFCRLMITTKMVMSRRKSCCELDSQFELYISRLVLKLDCGEEATRVLLFFS